jgi:hypothetical protein
VTTFRQRLTHVFDWTLVFVLLPAAVGILIGTCAAVRAEIVWDDWRCAFRDCVDVRCR